ncbi:MAG: LysR family transcriptional regulator [Alphaproteobacteria bacterium]|nr:LysR family transcriptional regulator [Alphaproteobacteria bacterium]
MELRHLRYFVAVAEELHFRRAAERLGIAQPALSQQIQQLENEIEVLLFHRLTRGVELTDAGKALLDDARAILARIEQAKAKAQQVARGDQGMIRIGFTGAASFNPLVPAIIQDYRTRFPGIAVTLVENPSSHLVDAVREGRVDAAFVRSPDAETTDLVAYPMLEEEMLIALPSGHVLAAENAPVLESLAREPFILFPRASSPGLYDAIVSACQRAGFTPNIVQLAPEVSSAVNLIAAGHGVSIVPASMQQMHPPGVAYRPIRGDAPRAPLSLAHRSNESSAAVRNLVGLARRAAARVEQPHAAS